MAIKFISPRLFYNLVTNSAVLFFFFDEATNSAVSMEWRKHTIQHLALAVLNERMKIIAAKNLNNL